ncbi:MAG TPA: DinB family protein [Thermoanaerobaculia bacterium]
MTDLTRPLISELEQEAATTRRVIERVPADRLDFQPHPKAMTLGQLALHVARIPGAFARLGRLDGLDAATSDFKNDSPADLEEVRTTLEASVTDALAFLGELDEEKATGLWRLYYGERDLMTLPRLALVRTLMLNHWYHHRGQLVTYLRILDVAVPSVYGPTADENPFAAAMAA